MSIEKINAAVEAAVQSLRNDGANGSDVARVLLAYAGNILLQTDGRETATAEAAALAEVLRKGTGFVYLHREGGFGCKRGDISAMTPVGSA
jgi:hypothetical protein